MPDRDLSGSTRTDPTPQVIDEVGRECWNRFVALTPHFALTQSYEWGEFKQSLGWKVIRVAIERQGNIVACAQALIRSTPFRLATIAYVPRGPLVDWPDTATATALLNGLHVQIRKHRAAFLKIEPPLSYDAETDESLQPFGFIASPHTIQPRCTMTLDLDGSLDELMGGFRKRTRYGIRFAKRRGVVVREGNQRDQATFYRLLQETAEREGFAIHTRDYYERLWRVFGDNDAALLIAYRGAEPVAGAIAIAFGDRAAYLYGASSGLHRESMPGYLLQWELIRWAKKKGCHTYDLWGIPAAVGRYTSKGEEPTDLERTDGLWGPYRFKRGFGQRVIYYQGAYDYVYSPLRYKAIDAAASWSGSWNRWARWAERLAG